MLLRQQSATLPLSAASTLVSVALTPPLPLPPLSPPRWVATGTPPALSEGPKSVTEKGVPGQ